MSTVKHSVGVPCGIVERTARSSTRRQNGRRSGTSPWLERCNARSAKAEIAESGYCSRSPQGAEDPPRRVVLWRGFLLDAPRWGNAAGQPR